MTQGIDYGHGITNIDHKTGIQYGVIPAHEVTWWNEHSESYYGKPSCPECGGSVRTYREERHAHYLSEFCCSDYACEKCKKVFDSQAVFPESPLSFFVKEKDIVAQQSGDDSDIFIFKSLYYSMSSFCSPCAPGAGYLLNPNTDGVKTYCFGHDWFDGEVAPYPVYSVKTNKRVFPESINKLSKEEVIQTIEKKLDLMETMAEEKDLIPDIEKEIKEAVEGIRHYLDVLAWR